jgi:hypothetical protein
LGTTAIFISLHVKEDLKLLEALASHCLKVAKEVLRRRLQDGVSEEAEDGFRSTQKPIVLSYEELGGLSDPGARDCAHDTEQDKGWGMSNNLYLL